MPLRFIECRNRISRRYLFEIIPYIVNYYQQRGIFYYLTHARVVYQTFAAFHLLMTVNRQRTILFPPKSGD